MNSKQTTVQYFAGGFVCVCTQVTAHCTQSRRPSALPSRLQSPYDSSLPNVVLCMSKQDFSGLPGNDPEAVSLPLCCICSWSRCFVCPPLSILRPQLLHLWLALTSKTICAEKWLVPDKCHSTETLRVTGGHIESEPGRTVTHLRGDH